MCKRKFLFIKEVSKIKLILKMEKLPKEHSISKKEQELKNMKLSQSKEGITHLTVSDEKERKKLWDEWKRTYPDSKKT